MKKCILWLILPLILLVASACSRDRVPDNVLEGLHKPEIGRLNPAVVQFNDAGFHLEIWLPALDAQYVLYINDRKVGQSRPGYWRNSVGYMITKELLNELLAASATGATLSVRLTSISEEYDISGAFDKYRDYVSEPVLLEVHKGQTRFTAARLLFPEWTHSSAPLIRCDPLGNIYLCWLEALNDVNQAFFSFSADNGETWSQVLNISRSRTSVYQVDLATDSAGHFYMTWMAYNDKYHPEVFFSRSIDNGATWHFPVRMHSQGTDAESPTLAVNERGDVYFARMQTNGSANLEVQLAVSRDLGATWNTRIIPVSDLLHNWKPLLATRANGRVELFLARRVGDGLLLDIHSSRDYGVSWQAKTVAAGNCFSSSENSLVRLGDGEHAYLSWGGSSSVGHAFSLWEYILQRNSSGVWGGVQEMHKLCPVTGTKAAIVPVGQSVDAVLDHAGCLYLLRSADAGRNWSIIETVAGSDGEYVIHSPDAVRLPTGKTCLAFIRKQGLGSESLYLMQFE